MTTTTTTTDKTEIVTIFKSRLSGAEIRIAYRSAAAFLAGAKEQTMGGWAVVSVIERPRVAITD